MVRSLQLVVGVLAAIRRGSTIAWLLALPLGADNPAPGDSGEARQERAGPLRDAEPSPHAPADSAGAPLSRREQKLRYLQNHPEYDERHTNGELTFFIAQQGSTGKPVVTARFNANPEILP